MYNFLLFVLVLDGLFLGVVILLQSGKGGGLAAMGGGAAATDVLGGRQATTLLTRATWVAGSAFMALSLVLAIMSSRSNAPTSVLEGIGAPAATVPEPLVPPVGVVPPVGGEAAPEGGSAPPDASNAGGSENEPPEGSSD